MQCRTCKEASSTQLPVSEVCRQCHQYSKWCQAAPKNHRFAVTLQLRQFDDGSKYITTNPNNPYEHKVLATTIQMVDFAVPE